MSINRNYPLQVCLVLVILAAAAAYPVARYGTGDMAIAAAVGALLSTVNALAGYLTIEYSFERSHTTFLKAVLGGMGVRMVLMLGALLFSIKVVGLDAVALCVSLLSFYVVYLAMEILFLQKRATSRSQNP